MRHRLLALLFPFFAAIGQPKSARAACDQPSTPAELADLVERADQSVGRDAQSFNAAADSLAARLPCLEALADPALAARIHRVHGLRAFVAGQGSRTLSAFAASRQLEPGYRFSVTVFPSAHPVQRLWAQSAEHLWKVEAVPPLGSTLIWFDGRVGLERPVSVPTLVQLQREDGSVAATSYAWPGDALPSDPLLATVRAPSGHSIDVPHERRFHVGLAVGAGVAALAAGGSYALAYNTAMDYRNNPHGNSELEELRGRANALVYVSAGLGAVAFGSGLGAALAWPR